MTMSPFQCGLFGAFSLSCCSPLAIDPLHPGRSAANNVWSLLTGQSNNTVPILITRRLANPKELGGPDQILAGGLSAPGTLG